jgi:hypothetical protein
MSGAVLSAAASSGVGSGSGAASPPAPQPVGAQFGDPRCVYLWRDWGGEGGEERGALWRGEVLDGRSGLALSRTERREDGDVERGGEGVRDGDGKGEGQSESEGEGERQGREKGEEDGDKQGECGDPPSVGWASALCSHSLFDRFRALHALAALAPLRSAVGTAEDSAVGEAVGTAEVPLASLSYHECKGAASPLRETREYAAAKAVLRGGGRFPAAFDGWAVKAKAKAKAKEKAGCESPAPLAS